MSRVRGVGEQLGDTEVLSPPWSLYEIFLTFLHILTVPSPYDIIILKRIDEKLEKILHLYLKSPVCLLCVKQLKWSIFRLSAGRSKLLGADEPNETPAQQKATTSLTARYTIYTTKTNHYNRLKIKFCCDHKGLPSRRKTNKNKPCTNTGFYNIQFSHK